MFYYITIAIMQNKVDINIWFISHIVKTSLFIMV